MNEESLRVSDLVWGTTGDFNSFKIIFCGVLNLVYWINSVEIFIYYLIQRQIVEF